MVLTLYLILLLLPAVVTARQTLMAAQPHPETLEVLVAVVLVVVVVHALAVLVIPQV
jgi:hypothetical protein